MAQWAISVQLQEDYIGRPSRISRRVSAKLQPLRTMQRILLNMVGEYTSLAPKRKANRATGRVYVGLGVFYRS